MDNNLLKIVYIYNKSRINNIVNFYKKYFYNPYITKIKILFNFYRFKNNFYIYNNFINLFFNI